MTTLPRDFQARLGEILQTAHSVEGFLTAREMRFLALLAACPTTEGAVLELGAYHGKSTVILAQAAALCSTAKITTVDCGPLEPLTANLRRLRLDEQVDVRHQRSQEFAPTWRLPLRLLWHDGANEYDIVRRDVELLTPHLADRAIVAFHDVLNPTGDRVLVFMEQILADERFGPVGLCGSIGWAQFRPKPVHHQPVHREPFHRERARSRQYDRQRKMLTRRLRAVAPYQGYGKRPPTGLAKLHYKLLRTITPHGAVRPSTWLKKVA